jgi:hypothetical protein
MTPEENKAIILRLVDELKKGNYDVVKEICSPDFAFYTPNFPGWPRGLDGARRLAKDGEHDYSPDTQLRIDDIFAADDKVVMRYSIYGTYLGEPKNGSPKTGEKFAMGIITIYRLVDGKIVDDWGVQVTSPTNEAWS